MSSTRKIGVNSMFLAVRKVITFIIAFYSTRLLLSRLGADDFGLYGLVGSIVVLFSALRGLFSTSIQRFINVAKGNNDANQINEIFSIGLKIHIWVALIFTIAVEIAGVFLIPTLNLPPGNEGTAFAVLQFTIFATCVTILTIPYDAIIIAHERFKAYSIIAVVESILKLMIIWGLYLTSSNRVIVYSAMYFGVTIIVRFINSIYCHHTFGAEVKYHSTHNKKMVREMTVFAGWQFCGNMGFALANSGINLIINIFGGVIVNAARSIAYQLMNAVTQFVSDMNLSFQPQTIIAHTEKKNNEFRKLIYLNSKASFIMGMVLSVPLFICTQGILKIWLGEVPKYTIEFTRWILVYLMIRSLHGAIDLIFKADGNLKQYQITELVIMALNLPASWIALKLGAPFWSVFAIMSALEFANLIAIIYLAQKQVGFSWIDYLENVGYRVALTIGVISAIILLIEPYIEHVESIWSIIAISILSMVGSILLAFILILSKTERKGILTKFHLA